MGMGKSRGPLTHGYRCRLRAWATDYGRTAGWIVERSNSPIAVLSDPRAEDMFWVSYHLEVTTHDAALRDRMATADFWLNEASSLTWRNRELGTSVADVVVAERPFPQPGRLSARGLYLPIDPPRLWDRLVLRLYRSIA